MAPVVQSGTGTKATLPKRNRKIESGKRNIRRSKKCRGRARRWWLLWTSSHRRRGRWVVGMSSVVKVIVVVVIIMVVVMVVVKMES